MTDERIKLRQAVTRPIDKIRAVHIITKLELGGAQVNTIYTFQNLDSTNFEAYLLSGPGGILNDRVKDEEGFSIIKNLSRSIHPINDLRAFFQVRRELKRIRPHVVHTHSSKAGIIGRLAAYFLRVPVIVHSVHGFSFSPFQSFFKRAFYVTAEKLVSRMTGHFVFVSEDDIGIAKEKKLVIDTTDGKKQEKRTFSLIRSGFPFSRFPLFSGSKEERDTLRRKHGIEPGDFVCGIIAPFKPQKGLFHLIEIAERVIGAAKEKRVIFMITGDGKLRHELEQKLEEKGIAEHFRLPGFIFDIGDAIDCFDLGVSTALWEGLPQSLVQLRLKKKAAVVSDIPGNREVIKENKNGFLVPVTEYDAFAGRILQLIENKGDRERMERFDEEDFSPWDANFMVKEQEQLYQKLLG